MADRKNAFGGLPVTYQFRCAASDVAVRALLSELRLAMIDAQVSEDITGSVEIAVAEGLNNIVEHACIAYPDAIIRVEMRVTAAHVFVQLFDSGDPLPGLVLPGRAAPNLDVDRADLPEGGFGWSMIRMLTERLDYRRINDTNHLKMWFAHDIGPG